MSRQAARLTIGPRSTPGSRPGPTVRADIAAANFSANASTTGVSTKKRLAAVQASPPLRILAIIAPSTAASRSASAKTRNGALPPSSIEQLTTLFAASAKRIRPTSVEPVKESLRHRGSARMALHTADERFDGRTLTTPGGTPASSRSSPTTSAVSGVSEAGLRMTGQPAAQRRTDLARRHGGREVPWRDQQRDAHRLLQDQDPVGAGRRRRDLREIAHRLLGIPAEELGGVGRLGPGVLQGLAVLEGHQPRQLVLARRHQLEGPAQDLGPLPRRPRRPLGTGLVGRGHGGEAVLHRGAGDTRQHLLGGGVAHVDPRPVGRVAPFAGDQQPGRQVSPRCHSCGPPCFPFSDRGPRPLQVGEL